MHPSIVFLALAGLGVAVERMLTSTPADRLSGGVGRVPDEFWHDGYGTGGYRVLLTAQGRPWSATRIKFRKKITDALGRWHQLREGDMYVIYHDPAADRRFQFLVGPARPTPVFIRPRD